jgi:hypothetical protein
MVSPDYRTPFDCNKELLGQGKHVGREKSVTAASLSDQMKAAFPWHFLLLQ